MTSAGPARTMIVSVPVIAQDPSLLDEPDIGRWMSLANWLVIKGEEPYHDGPVSRRVAVIDLDAQTGRLRPGARFVDGRPTGETSRYEVEAGEQDEWGEGEIARVESDAFLQTSVFGAVIKTLQMFERAPMLGRPLQWAFPDEQLLVVPRAGEMANAFYDRDTHSLQFFSAVPDDPQAQPIHTALSHDVVAHETAHAVLDGLCPDLYDGLSPQSRALHESFADVTSLLTSLTDRYRLNMELDLHGRSLSSRTTFSRLAEQLGQHLSGPLDGASALRDANNSHTLDPSDDRKDRLGRPRYLDSIAPHDLSLVMTGALYGVFRRLAAAGKKRYSAGIPRSYAALDLKPAALGAYLAGQRVTQMVIRALDHLPPGEASFADFGRAILAADTISNPGSPEAREWLIAELAGRRVVRSPRELDFRSRAGSTLEGADDPALLDDGRLARSFVQRHRQALGVPGGSPFRVSARRLTARPRPALVLRVSWQESEDNPAARDIAARRAFVTGTTVVLDASNGRLLSVLTSDTGAVRRHADERDRMVRWLRDEGLLLPPEETLGPDGRRLRGPMVARSVRQTMRLTGGVRAVHCLNFPWPSC